ncbi:MAG TPA: GxxExxY protein [Lacunisphaera sp.]|jgi:GxxExxY protein|nr:GxxExxY protein [Lacunisphaera sp.]
MNQAEPNPYDLCGQIIGSAMKVHRTLGFGFLESVYAKALTAELIDAGHKVDAEVPIKVWYGNQIVGDFFADLVVDESTIVELKAVERLATAHEVQLVNYLTATRRDEGLLLNFGSESLEFKKKFRRNPTRNHRAHSINSVQTS